jgi:hypothetical protein
MDDVRSGVGTRIEELEARCDMLSRIACRALEHIEQSKDGLEVLILKDAEVQAWWAAHKEADRRAAKVMAAKERARVEKERLAQIKQETLATLTSEQIKALGIK